LKLVRVAQVDLAWNVDDDRLRYSF